MLNRHDNPLDQRNHHITGLYLMCLLIGMSTVVSALPLIRLSFAKDATATAETVKPQDTSLQGLKEKGQILFVSRKFAAATETYELLVKTYPEAAEVPDIYLRLVTLYENQKDSVNAAKAIERGYEAATAQKAESLKQAFLEMAKNCRCQVNLKG